MLCTCVIECDLPLLRRYLRAGAPVDASDYDRRTALHCSAAEGNLAMVRLYGPLTPGAGSCMTSR